MKKNIAIIMGGYSSEYLISLKSGKVVFETLKNSNYNCFQIHVLKDKWVYVNESKKEFKIDIEDLYKKAREQNIIKTHFIKISF